MEVKVRVLLQYSDTDSSQGQRVLYSFHLILSVTEKKLKTHTPINLTKRFLLGYQKFLKEQSVATSRSEKESEKNAGKAEPHDLAKHSLLLAEVDERAPTSVLRAGDSF